MGQNISSSQQNKFQFLDRKDVQQQKFTPINQSTSLQQIDYRESNQYQGPIQGPLGQYTGLLQFQLPQKYSSIMKNNPLEYPKPQKLIGHSNFYPFMFKKSVNVYHGEWLKGQPHGYGKIFNPDKDFYYQGYFQSGLPQYYGVFLTNNIQYRGEIKYGRAQGMGKYTQDTTTIQGYFKQNYPFHNCTQTHPNYIFHGQYQNNRWKSGILKFNNQSCSYQGQFLNGLMHGKGILKTIEYQYSGQFSYGLKQGYGQIMFKSGENYKGQFKNDQINGIGKYYDNKGKFIYQGEWKNGKVNGDGVVIIDEKKAVAVLYENGQLEKLR